MTEDILSQLKQLRVMYAEAAPTDQKSMEQYAWIVCKALNKHTEELGALMCRQMLADVMRMPLARPSLLYSSVLWAATKVASVFADFHFVPFLNIWNPVQNLRKEDFQPGKSEDGKAFPSLAERMTRMCLLAQLIRPEEKVSFSFEPQFGFHPVTPMVVTKVTQSDVKGRKMFFASLIATDGTEVMTEAHALRANPLVPSDKRHYANVGQMYNVVLRDKKDGAGLRVVDAVLSPTSLSDVFRTTVGYVDSIDAEHGHTHIFDSLSRHFVSSGQRFVRAQKGDFVLFVPVIPLNSKFKSAIILPCTKSKAELLQSFPPREIRITSINTEKQYIAWELTDAANPITEQLSVLQLSQGETSPSFTKGFMNLNAAKEMMPELAINQTVQAIIFLRRGKDKTKRPVVACIVR